MYEEVLESPRIRLALVSGFFFDIENLTLTLLITLNQIKFISVALREFFNYSFLSFNFPTYSWPSTSLKR